MITKFEVFVSFLQVYGIIFNFDLQLTGLSISNYSTCGLCGCQHFFNGPSFLIDAFGFSIPADYFVYKFIGTIIVFF